MTEKTRRIRDPIHDLIVFDLNDADQLAWKLEPVPEICTGR